MLVPRNLTPSPYWYCVYDCSSEETYITIIGVVQVVLAIVATSLNSVVIVKFCRHEQIRKKIANILFFHQACVDAFNSACYILPLGLTNTLIKYFESKYHAAMLDTMLVLVFISVWSSFFTFVLIAVQRFVALSKPFWHQIHVTPRKVKIASGVLWLLTGLGAMFITLLYKYFIAIYMKVVDFQFMLAIVLMVLISGIMLWTFCKAFQSTRAATVSVKFKNRNSNAQKYLPDSDTSNYDQKEKDKSQPSLVLLARAKKERKLTIIFITIYLIFLAAFLPRKIIYLHGCTYVIASVAETMLGVSSLVNPILTITLKEDYKINKHSLEGPRSTSITEDSTCKSSTVL